MEEDILKIRKYLKEHPQYHLEAYQFVLESLRVLIKELNSPRHVSGPELLNAIKSHGIDVYGFLAPKVFEHWGINETLDFGYVVFNLVEMGILRKTDKDNLEDFRNVFAFETAFRQGFQQSLEQY